MQITLQRARPAPPARDTHETGVNRTLNFFREQPRKLRWRVFSFSLREGLRVEIACYGGDCTVAICNNHRTL